MKGLGRRKRPRLSRDLRRTSGKFGGDGDAASGRHRRWIEDFDQARWREVAIEQCLWWKRRRNGAAELAMIARTGGDRGGPVAGRDRRSVSGLAVADDAEGADRGGRGERDEARENRMQRNGENRHPPHATPPTPDHRKKPRHSQLKLSHVQNPTNRGLNPCDRPVFPLRTAVKAKFTPRSIG